MIDFEYRFPLFDSIMVGSLSPFLPENNYSVEPIYASPCLINI